MKRILQYFAAIVALAVIITWLAGGANRGWTKTSVPVKTLDEVTGIEGITYHKKFVPGVDFLAAGLAAAAGLGLVSLFFRKAESRKTNNQQPTTN